ncbi:MAG: xanthine dehydrogenase family protein molybdopterin-binding subunit, partial [Lacisediminimonas sp.]|nr:xanthine dehydrogenase family protein molybdopterin-binding subunit [Lacisediminimonas sp.]
GRYTDDINLPGQAYAVFLRSPHAHASIVGIDTAAARAAPGVLAVLTGPDYIAAGLHGIPHVPMPVDAVEFTRPAFPVSLTGSIFNQPHLPLAVERVRHVGEAVAMVIAETVAQARDAAELIAIEYQLLDAVVDACDAMAPGAPQLWDGAPGNLCFQARVGDQAAAQRIIDQADHVVRRRFRNSRVVNCQMEPRAAIGDFDAATGLHTLVSGSQGSHRLKMCLLGALGAAPDKVRVICPDVGGGFGSRTMLYVEQLAVVWAARQLGRPVKWTGERSESFLSDYQGRDQVIDAAVAFASDGRILAISNAWTGNVGAHTVSYVPMSNGTRIMSTVYHVPVAAVQVNAVLTNTVPTAPYRGAGRPEANHVMERVLDIAAHELGLDRVEIRRRNLVRRDQFPYRSAMGLTYDSGDFTGNMERALAMADWHGFAQRREHSRSQGRLRGIGVANYIEAPVGAPRERILLNVLPEGAIDILSGTQSQGQGHATTFAQVLAARLGVPVTAMRLHTGDTAMIPLGGGSHSDRSMRIGGALLVEACDRIIEQGRALAAQALEVDAASLHYADGAWSNEAGDRRIGLFALAAQMAALTGDAKATLSASAEFTGRMPAHPTGSVVCELEVDPDTGDVQLLHYASVDDVGQVINPLIIEGQVHGGLAQGIGQALLERYCMDPASGQVLSGSWQDYGMPRAGSVPPLSIALTEDPTAGNALRVKGGGESGITPATAVIFNALADALQAHDEELPMPATPARIWNYLHTRKGIPDGN